ncbi:hypothetical protein HOP50_12g66120 [Chloropicon primus]|uniref:Uncharacterized protein n=1 Tax=Chloropicon primus TaxID=1764295 RepID=A0A5B8MWN2_9CHLO|nr:hypothetical protein A3770_12p65930 [Chloropicon primus]UPR03283.1 hypothetical protein HOP50_12g66120 [Chloropicon primus]|eukprot:QDZ24075.1 hypothetical protein A3770_12p65930 [Chloropicon primus]
MPRMACNQHMPAPMGTRKHLNYLIYDYNKSRSPEVTENFEDTMDETLESGVDELVDPTTPKQKPWTMPYWQGGEHAHELSGLVSNRRTPSGNFLNKSNPSLWSKTKPESDYSKSGSLKESITLEALRTIRKSPKK